MHGSVAHLRRLVAVAALAIGSVAFALPIQLNSQDGTQYYVNTDVDPVLNLSNASGALTNATYTQPVTVTSYYVAFTPWFLFTTVYTVQRQIDVPLRNAFAGFNGLAITAVNGTTLPSPLLYNPGEALAAEDCPDSNGANKQLTFQTQTFAAQNLQLTRKVYVPHTDDFVRWFNLVTNTGSSPAQVAIALRGMLGSGDDTKVASTSNGDSSVTIADLWFTTAQQVPQGTTSTQPRIGFVVQGANATAPATNVGINSLGQVAFTYTPTIPAGGSVAIMTFVTVQGNNKQVKNEVEKIVGPPLANSAIKCLSEQELQQVVNFSPITPPTTKTSTTITLDFKDDDTDDKIVWKGKLTIGAGISLQNLPVTVDVGGITQSFLLNKQGAANDGGGNKFSLNADLKNGVTKAGTYGFSFQLKGDFAATLAPYGLTNATVSDVPVTVPVSFTAGAGQYATDQPFTYKAKTGKTGTATATN